MAELSAETQAIIKTLKDEGQSIRNRGTNSIRSVKIEMAKFHDVFNTISVNIEEQTKILRQQVGIDKEAIKVQRTKEQLEELQEKQKYEDIDSESGGKTNENIERIGDRLESAFSLKNLALAGTGLFVGYNLLKGFIDDQTAGGFSEMEKAIANTDWSGLGASINSMIEAAVRFNEWLGNLPALLIGGGLVGTAARNFGAGLVTGGIGPRRAPAGAEDGPRGLGAIRTNVLMAITGLAWVYGESVKTWLTEQGVPEDVGALGVDAVTAGISGATIAAMFGLGPAGILIGAIAGLAWVAGNAFKNYLERRNAEAEQNFLDRYNQMGDVVEEAMRGNLTPEEIESLRQMALEAGDRIRNATSQTARDALETARSQIEDALLENIENQEIGVFGRGQDFDPAFRAAFGKYYDINPETGRSTGDDSGIRAIAERLGQQYDEGSMLDRWFWGDRDEFIQRSLRDGLNAYIFDRSDPNRVQRLVDPDMAAAIRGHLEQTFEEGGRFNEFRTGTQGFMDFGAGQFAVLHGREAVVPFNTAAGRFLDQYFTENWEPKAVNNQRLQTAATGGTGSPVVVINAPTTVSPTVNNVSGGKSVNQVSVRTGGGNGFGGGTSNPYGLPYAVN
jgi:hypothetical protein